MTAYRVAVIGAGQVSNMHFRGFRDHPDRVQVVAVVDPSPERREWAENTYDVAQTYEDIESLLGEADFSVAVVCTPSLVRLETVTALARAGKHVLVEKPMADTLEEARDIVAVCADASVLLAVDQNFRDHYSFGLARDAISTGVTGRILGIDHRELVFRTAQGWRADARHHALAVMGVHWFDGFRYLLPDDADWLSARTYSSPAAPAAGETDAFVQIHFGEATVNYAQSFSSRVERIETVVIGEKATLALTYDTLTIARADGSVEVLTNPLAGQGKPESAYRSLERLLDALESGTQPSHSGLDNLKTLSLLSAAYASAATDRPVVLKGGLL